MSRYIINNNNLTIAYGYDRMTPEGGYFFQVFDDKADPDNDLILDEGLIQGISKSRMLFLMNKYEVKNKEHLLKVVSDLKI